MSCETCGGTRHRYDDESRAWVKCECAAKEERCRKYERAGVARRYWKETWKGFLRYHKIQPMKSLLLEVAKLSQGRASSGWFVLTGRPSAARNRMASLVLISACSGGIGARSVTLPGLIDVEFQHEDRGVYRAPVLVCYVGSEPAHKWNRHVIEKLLRIRWGDGLFTLLVAEVGLGRLTSFYKSGVFAESLTDRFIKVEVSEK